MRALLLALGLAVAAYAALCAAMWLGQRSLLYFPQATQVPADATDFSIDRGDATLRGWAFGPADGTPLLYFGGNGERVEANRADFARWFPGHRVYLLAYRGYGASDGAPAAALLLDDALAFHDAVAARHPGQAADVVGRSLGSSIASHVAAQRPVARLALITPFDSMANVAQGHYPWLPVRWLLRERYDTAAALARYDGRLLVLRAGRDAVIPPPRTDALLATLPPGTAVAVFAQADHNDIHRQPGYGEALSGFLH